MSETGPSPKHTPESRPQDFMEQLLGIIPELLENTGSVLIPGIGSWKVRKKDNRVIVGFKPHAKLKNNLMNRMKKSAAKMPEQGAGGFIPSEALAMRRRRPRPDIDLYSVFEEVVTELGMETASDGRLKVTWQGSRAAELKKPVIEQAPDNEPVHEEPEGPIADIAEDRSKTDAVNEVKPLPYEPEVFEPEEDLEAASKQVLAKHDGHDEHDDAALEIREPGIEDDKGPVNADAVAEDPGTVDTGGGIVSVFNPDSLLRDRELWKVPPATTPLVPDFSLEKNTSETDISPTIASKPGTTAHAHDDDTNEYREKREQFYSPPRERSLGLIILVILVTLGLIATVVYSLYIHGDLNAWLPPEWQYAPRLPSYLQRVTEMLVFPLCFRITKSSTTIFPRSNT